MNKLLFYSIKINVKKIEKVRAILEYIRYMIGSTTKAWSCCMSKSDSYMLWVWFISPFVLSEHTVKTSAPLQDCTKDR